MRTMRTLPYLALTIITAGFATCLSARSVSLASAKEGEGTRPLEMFQKVDKDKGTRPLEMFQKGDKEKPCYDRSTEPKTAVTDLHLHPQPFGGSSIPYQELMSYLDKNKVRFVLLYGIGQTLPYDSKCTYYLDCIGTNASPGIKNDFENAANYIEFPQDKIHVALSMTFPDLANPKNIVAGIKLLDAEYPGLFQWMGEVNLHKEALRRNGHEPASIEDIAQWKDFMVILQKRGIPISLHSDLGDDNNPTKNLALMREVLRVYPNNKIVWMHMGLSRELTKMKPKEHIKLMSEFLDKNPNLYLDISWTAIAEAYFDTPEKRALYVKFFNRYPTRILAGTDFVASGNKNLEIYTKEANVTGSILADLSDEAFRAIALGQNYFDLAPNLSNKFEAPKICSR
ncbi:hypothetical protein FACHB389_05000 [Nostoc calcicola FACHB-389]|nr:hypothetical protein FACHB389_05000 [Nostoc calcicola FACHB-389]